MLLSDKAIAEAVDRVHFKGTGTYQVNIADRAIAKDAVKAVVEWGDEMCPHRTATGFKPFTSKDFPQKKHECEVCWQSLLEEAK